VQHGGLSVGKTAGPDAHGDRTKSTPTDISLIPRGRRRGGPSSSASAKGAREARGWRAKSAAVSFLATCTDPPRPQNSCVTAPSSLAAARTGAHRPLTGLFLELHLASQTSIHHLFKSMTSMNKW